MILSGNNNAQHHFGHPCQAPDTITIDGIRFEGDSDEAPAILGNFNKAYKDASYKEKVPYGKPKKITVKNVTVANGKTLQLSRNPVMFRDTEVTGLKP